MYCDNCGESLAAGEKRCISCGSAVLHSAQRATPYENEIMKLLVNNERVVKKYHVMIPSLFQQRNCHMIVTNRRVIKYQPSTGFDTAGYSKEWFIESIEIDKIVKVQTLHVDKWDLRLLILGIVTLPIIIGILFLLAAHQKLFGVILHTKGHEIIFGALGFKSKLTGGKYGPEARKATEEITRLIYKVKDAGPDIEVPFPSSSINSPPIVPMATQ